MKKKRMAVLGASLLVLMLLVGCSNQEVQSNAGAEISVSEDGEENKAELADGDYSVDFHTDSSMFRINEAYDGKGKLTVKNGEMTVHISLGSKNIVNLYPGTAEDAEKDGAEWLQPTIDNVTYSDGYQEEVYGFNVPVPALEEEFDLALIGKKGKWYDHKVSVSNPEPWEEAANINASGAWEDGSYTIELTFEGGSGKARILSPATIVVSQGSATATIQWSSPNYDYMIVDGEKYMPVNTEGNSVFEIPVNVFDEPFQVIGGVDIFSR